LNCNTYFKVLIKPYAFFHLRKYARHDSTQEETRSKEYDETIRLRNINCVWVFRFGGVGKVLTAGLCSPRRGRSIGCCLG
jgi:hypothetical protein